MQNSTSSPRSNHSHEQLIVHEYIRQARNISNVALASTLFGLVGAAILITGNIPEGSVTTAVSLVANLHCSNLSKDANDRLDKLLAELDHE